MMTYTEFQNAVLERIKIIKGRNCEVTIREVPKNNGIRLMGISIMEKGSDICPTIYLESFYDAYKKGEELPDVVQDICEIYRQNMIIGTVNFEFFLDYGRVKNRIFLKMINYEENREMLANVPHRRFLDLAVVCYYAYMNDLMGKGSIQIDKDLLSKWEISEEELFFDAEKNTRNILGMELKDMHELLFGMLLQKWNSTTPEEVKLIEDEVYGLTSEVPMYIMTLRGGSFGAVCMSVSEWMEQFGRECGGSFFILPSSIHELILIPENCGETAENLQKMVCEVNASCVSAEEKLSDSVYYYNLQTKNVELV